MSTQDTTEQKNKRYLVTTSYYILAPDDESARKQEIKRVAELNKAEDCRATVDEIIEAPFGKSLGARIL